MPDEPYQQPQSETPLSGFANRVSAVEGEVNNHESRLDKLEQGKGESGEPKKEGGADALLARIAALEQWKDNLQGDGSGITVTDGVIGYNPPPITAFCNGDGTITIKY